jgi:arabinose-5-phosphate isomerase
MRVEQVMRRGKDVRLASCRDTVREVFAAAALRGRRTGAVMLLDAAGRLRGLFTDSDLARLFEQRRDHLLDRPIEEVMTRDPITVRRGARLQDAVDVLIQKRISELPVVDDDGRPLGLLDITDVIGLLPNEDRAAPAQAA